MTLVSIIIANYNYGRFLRESIDSALKQSYSPIEVIVVDDGSTDHSREIIESYSDQVIGVFQKNGGHTSACNTGFSKSNGDIICFLDADDVFVPHKVEEVVEIFEKNLPIDWVFHELQYIDIEGNLLNLKPDSYELPEATFLDLRQAFAKAKFPYGPPPTPCLSFRRRILKTLMPIPEAMGIWGDHFLKFGALSIASGIHSPLKLTLQRIHGANSFTKQRDASRQGQANMKTAFYLREAFPHTAAFTNKLFAGSFARLLKMWGLRKTLNFYECRQYIERYASPMMWLKYGARILFIYGKTH